MGRFLEINAARRENITAVHPAGQDQHLQIILAQQDPALVLQVNAGIAKHAANGNQFLIVNLQHVATLHRLAEHFLGIEVLAEVDVEYLQLAFTVRHGIKKTVDGFAGHHAALSQRAETYGTGFTSQAVKRKRIWNVVPCHAFLDVIARHAGIVQRHLYGARRIRHGFNQAVKSFLAEVIEDFMP